jgi:hypothetical protein
MFEGKKPIEWAKVAQYVGLPGRENCGACHFYGGGGVATEVDWDWRSAGKTRNGQGYKEKNYTQGDGKHRATYKSIKGSFKWGEDLVPHYAWFDGQTVYKTIESKLDPSNSPINMNAFKGAADDPNSRIWPFKRMHTIQPYDKGNNTLVYMHLWGDDDDSYWGNYDFGRAIKVGMEKYNIPIAASMVLWKLTPTGRSRTWWPPRNLPLSVMPVMRKKAV